MPPTTTYKRNNMFHVDTTLQFHEMCVNYFYHASFESSPQNMSSPTNDHDSNMAPFINLFGPGNGEESCPLRSNYSDAWMRNAQRIFETIRQISDLLRANLKAYTNRHIFDMNCTIMPMIDEEVILFESSIASFLTSTTGQIDTLRQSILDTKTSVSANTRMVREEIQTHRSGIISHLVTSLEELMAEFQLMQVTRNRNELEFYHDPYKCSYQKPGVVEFNDDIPCTQNDCAELDEEFTAFLSIEGEDFKKMYEDADDENLANLLLNNPLPIFPTRRNRDRIERTQHKDFRNKLTSRDPLAPRSELPQMQHLSNETKISSITKQKTEFPPQNVQQESEIVSQTQKEPEYKLSQNESNNNLSMDILQQEQIFLTNTVQNTKLDSVHKVESQMMQITSLLSQFASLISQQQEEIQIISEATSKSRENVDDGREKLVQATEQRKKGRHYFALIIVGMGFILLFMNYIVV
eukprot:353610_1